MGGLAPLRIRDLVDVPLPAPERDSFMDEIWGISVRNLQEYESYFTALELLFDRRVFGPNRYIIENYGQLIDLIAYLKTARNVLRGPQLLTDIRRNWAGRHFRIPRTPQNDEKILRSVELAIRIWMMLALGTGGLSRKPGEPPYPWEAGDTLNSLLMRTFPRTGQPETYLLNVPLFPQYNGGQIIKDNDPPEPDADRVFSDLFNLWDMERLAGFQIKWTDNILSHLLVQKHSGRKFHTTVLIFHHAAVLRELDGRNPQSHLIFTHETLDTLALLIPPENDCRYWYRLIVRSARERYKRSFRTALPYLPRWLQRLWERYQTFLRLIPFFQNARLNSTDVIDPMAGRLPEASRRVCDYHYWRPRLLLLEKEFDESAPRDLLRWWRDRRKRREWATFWIAFVGFVLALIAVILAVFSAITGYVSMKQAQQQNVIALRGLTAGSSSTSMSNTCCAVACCGVSSTGNNSIVTMPLTMNNTTLPTNSAALAIVTYTTFTVVTETVSTTQDITTTLLVSSHTLS